MGSNENGIYAQAGVDYGTLDGIKRLSQRELLKTLGNLNGTAFEVLSWTVGESVQLIKIGVADSIIIVGVVNEGIGTKPNAADDFCSDQETYYQAIGWDTASSALNDLITLGVRPVSIQMHLAVGSGNWFNSSQRNSDLITGFKDACDFSGCAWVGGETPALGGVVLPNRAVLSCSAFGVIEKKTMNPYDICSGDRIVILSGRGPHINGYSLLRKMAESLPQGYGTIMGDGREFGAAILEKTPIYVPVVMRLLNQNLGVKYGINVSGHGLRKLMRHVQPFEYVVTQLPEPQVVFDFIQSIGNYDDRFMLETFNCGAGFCLIVSQEDTPAVLDISRALGFDAFDAGYVEASSKRKVNIIPKGIVYEEDSLAIR